jgi:hypothetical protein
MRAYHTKISNYKKQITEKKEKKEKKENKKEIPEARKY